MYSISTLNARDVLQVGATGVIQLNREQNNQVQCPSATENCSKFVESNNGAANLADLHEAIRLQRLDELVRLLNIVDFQENVRDMDHHHSTSLMHLCAETGFIDGMRLLRCLCKVDVGLRDQLDNTPLHIAARRGDVVCCRYLVACGADVTPLNSAGLSPLCEALATEKYNAARYLCSLLPVAMKLYTLEFPAQFTPANHLDKLNVQRILREGTLTLSFLSRLLCS